MLVSILPLNKLLFELKYLPENKSYHINDFRLKISSYVHLRLWSNYESVDIRLLLHDMKSKF